MENNNYKKLPNYDTHRVCELDIQFSATTTFSFVIPKHLVDEEGIIEKDSKSRM